MSNASIPRVQLTSRWWKNAKPESVKTRSLDLALNRFEKAESDLAKLADANASKLLAEAIQELAGAVKEVSSECDHKSDRDLLKALKQLEDLAGKRRKELEGTLKEHIEEESGEAPVAESDLLDVGVLRRLMKVLPNRPMAFAFGVGDGGATYLVIDKHRKGGSLMSKLKELSGCSSATFGIASVEGKELCLDTHGPKLAGLAKKTREFLRENKPMPFTHVRVQGESAAEAEADGDDAKGGGGAASEAKSKSKGKSKAEPEVDPEIEPAKGKKTEPSKEPTKEPQVTPTPGPGKEDPPLNMITPLMLSASVGAGGKNKPEDVETVQAYLNRNGAGIGVDGKCGPQTINAIKAFQKSIGFSVPDGRVDPGGKTEAALNGQKVQFPKGGGGGYGGGGYGGGGGKGGGYGGGGGGGGGGYGGAGRQKIPHEVQSSDPTYKKKAPGPEYIHKKAGTVKETSPVDDAVEYARRIAKAVAEQKKKVGDSIKETVDKLAKAEQDSRKRKSEDDAERARKMRELAEKAYHEAQEHARKIKDAAERLVTEKSQQARKGLEEAAKAVNEGMKTARQKAEEGIEWIKQQAFEE